jgi:hypothetical protein
MRDMIKLTLTILLLGSASVALADCMFNGKSFPTGSVVGDRVCMPDGKWHNR